MTSDFTLKKAIFFKKFGERGNRGLYKKNPRQETREIIERRQGRVLTSTSWHLGEKIKFAARSWIGLFPNGKLPQPRGQATINRSEDY